jgi:phospholipid transport system transporter-binding protein
VPADVSLAGVSALDANSIVLKGVLNFDTVPGLMKQVELLIKQSTEASVDFSEVEKTNSAGLALLLEIVRFMQLRNANVQFKNVPEQIAIVARAYGIDTALDSAEFARQATA